VQVLDCLIEHQKGVWWYTEIRSVIIHRN